MLHVDALRPEDGLGVLWVSDFDKPDVQERWGGGGGVRCQDRTPQQRSSLGRDARVLQDRFGNPQS